MAAARLLSVSESVQPPFDNFFSPCSGGVVHQGRHFDLDSVNAVDAVEEKNEDEDEGDLESVSLLLPGKITIVPTFIPYCNFATRGLSEIKLNIFRLIVKGIGTTKAMKSTISDTKMAKTCTCC